MTVDMLQLADFSVVIFDLDGLILDTEPTFRFAWQQAANQLGYSLTDDFWESLSGMQYQDILFQFRHHCGNDFALESFVQLSSDYWRSHVSTHGIRVKSGVFELINCLNDRQIPYCLATNSPQINARESLSVAGVDSAFPVIISRDQVQQGKPAPDLIFLAAKYLQTPVDHCLVIEDSWVGIQAASSAGAQSVLISSPNCPDYSLAWTLADYWFADLCQLCTTLFGCNYPSIINVND